MATPRHGRPTSRLLRSASQAVRRRNSVRVRTTLAAVVVVAATMAVGSMVMLHRIQESLEHDRRVAALSQAEQIAVLAASGHLPPVLGVPDEDTALAQVVTAGGRVVASSPNAVGRPAVGPPVHSTSPVVTTADRLPTGQTGHYGVVAVPTSLSGRPATAYTVYTFQTSDLAVSDATLGLLIVLSLLLGVVAVTTWVLVGRALGPIEAIRAEVAEITTHDLHRRVPEEATGDEVAALARTMNSMLDRLETSVARQRAFVADASHELRSPLASVRTLLEIGLAQGPAADWPAIAGDVLVDEQRMETLVADLLLLARLGSEEGPVTDAVVDLGACAVADAAGRRPPREVAISTVADGPAWVGLRPGLARRVVTNLVDNAQRHARASVTVRTGAHADGTVTLEVEDDGPGVQPADRERVFARFTRLDNARSHDEGGAGLGLAIVHDIAQRAGGSVAFADVPAGARVVVRLPAAEAPPGDTDPVAGGERPGAARPGPDPDPAPVPSR
jgi:signal transduction histidine kinase